MKINQELIECKSESPDKTMKVLENNFHKALEKKQNAVLKFIQIEQELSEEAEKFKDPKAEIAKISTTVPIQEGFSAINSTEAGSIITQDHFEQKKGEEEKQSIAPLSVVVEEVLPGNDIPSELCEEEKGVKQPNITDKIINR